MDEKAGVDREIDRLRRKLGKIDLELLDLLSRRMEVARDIGEWKRRNGLSIFDPIREEAVIAHLIQRNPGTLSARAIRGIFLEIFSSARSQQGILRVGCGGGAAGLLAAQSRFGGSDRFRLVRSAAGGEKLLRARSIDILVLPKEGVLALPAASGPKAHTLPWTICGEIEPPAALGSSPLSRHGFYIVALQREPSVAQEVRERQKAIFFLAGGSRESLDRWTGRLGGCSIRTGPQTRARHSIGSAHSISLWEAFDPPPMEALQEYCRQVCGDSAWIVRLGAYPTINVARL